MRLASDSNGGFGHLEILGNLRDEIVRVGSGYSVRAIALNQTALLIGFNSGVAPAIWVSQDPIGNAFSWIPVSGNPNGIKTAAPGFDGGFLVA